MALQDVYTAIITSPDVPPGAGGLCRHKFILMDVRFMLDTLLVGVLQSSHVETTQGN